MEPEFLYNKCKIPDTTSVKKALGASYAAWHEFRVFADDLCGQLTEEWKMYSSKSGWIMKLLLKKRNLLFFSPRNGYFRISFVFGDRAVSEVEKSNVPQSVKKELSDARKYAEGRGISFEVKNNDLLETLKILLKIKIEN